MNMFYPTDIFPFTDVEETDPETGMTDGLLARAEKAGVAPKIFYTNSSYEYWGRAASLIHMTAGRQEGRADSGPTRASTSSPAGSTDRRRFRPKRSGTRKSAESESVHLQHARAAGGDGRLGQGRQGAAAVAISAGSPTTSWCRRARSSSRRFPAWRCRRGQRRRIAWTTVRSSAPRGSSRIEPPKVGKPFRCCCRRWIATATRRPASACRSWPCRWRLMPDGTCGRRRSARRRRCTAWWDRGFRLPKTKAEREQKHDPRPSIEERYTSRAEYLEQVGAAARKLVESGYLLDRDVPKLIEHSAAEWDYLAR